MSWTPPAFLEIGPMHIYWYSIFILVGITAGYRLALPEAKRFRIPRRVLQGSLFFGVLPGIVGARIYHVFHHTDYYLDHPGQIPAIWNGGLAILGGLAFGALGLWYFAKRHRIPLLRLLDVWAPSVLLAQAIGRFGNWTNQEAFGPPTDHPWGIFIDPEHRPAEYVDSAYFHPTYFYEAGLSLVGLAILLKARPKLRKHPGRVLGAYLLIYAVGRFIVEFYRFGTAEVAGVAVAQVLAVAIAAAGAWLLLRSGRQESRQ